MLAQPNPGAYAISLLRLQAGKDSARVDFHNEVRQFETKLIEDALLVTEWNISAAAELLSMQRTTLNARIKALSITR